MQGVAIGDVATFIVHDLVQFSAGELHNNFQSWEELAESNPSPAQQEVLDWIKNKVSVFLYFQHYTGTFQQQLYDSDRPPPKVFPNKKICDQFHDFITQNILNCTKEATAIDRML
jgi:hypothetical protein